MTTRVCGRDTPSFSRVNYCRCTLRRAVVLWQFALTLKSTAIYHLLPFIPLYVFFKEVISQGVGMPRFVVCYIASSDEIASIPTSAAVGCCFLGIASPRKDLGKRACFECQAPHRRWDSTRTCQQHCPLQPSTPRSNRPEFTIHLTGTPDCHLLSSSHCWNGFPCQAVSPYNEITPTRHSQSRGRRQ